MEDVCDGCGTHYETQEDGTVLSDEEKVLIEELDAAIARAEAAEARVKELESRLAAFRWRPIAEYDAMESGFSDSVFGYRDGSGRGWDWDLQRDDFHTHFLQLPPVPGEG